MAKTNLQMLLEQLNQSNTKTKEYEGKETVEIDKEVRKVKNVSSKIQSKVNKYIEIWEESKELERMLRDLRKEIEPYMEERNITAIADSEDVGTIMITSQNRVETTSRYTSYDVDEVKRYLSPELFNECVVSVIDADKMLGLSKLIDNFPIDLDEFKVRKAVKMFTVKRP